MTDYKLNAVVRKLTDDLDAERERATKLREALVMARPYVNRDCVDLGTLDIIDAVLTETGVDRE